jgi:hypothetical protein
MERADIALSWRAASANSGEILTALEFDIVSLLATHGARTEDTVSQPLVPKVAL